MSTAGTYSHLSRLAEIEKYGYDSQVMRPYFEYSRVLKGILDITSKMYGVSYKPVTDAKSGIQKSGVRRIPSGQPLGRIYFDMFPRENKYKHYATFTLATGKAGFRLPEYVLVCNFPESHGANPDSWSATTSSCSSTNMDIWSTESEREFEVGDG